MDSFRKKPNAANDRTASSTAERRRIGRIVHDERGNASVDWLDAPSDYKRQVLEIQEAPPVSLSVQSPQNFDPYARGTTIRESKKPPPTRKDLRKLSEWIKMMRDLEEKKRNGEVG